MEGAKNLDEAMSRIQVTKIPAVEVVVSDEDHKIASELAKELVVTPEQIIPDGQYAEALDKVAEIVPDVKEKARKGKAKKADVIAAAKNPEKAKEILAGKKPAAKSKPKPAADMEAVAPEANKRPTRQITEIEHDICKADHKKLIKILTLTINRLLLGKRADEVRELLAKHMNKQKA